MLLERMARNPFVGAVDGTDMVELLREHRPDSPVYASTARGTMRFVDRRDGLLLDAELSKSDRATRTAVRTSAPAG